LGGRDPLIRVYNSREKDRCKRMGSGVKERKFLGTGEIKEVAVREKNGATQEISYAILRSWGARKGELKKGEEAFTQIPTQ